MRTIHLSCPTCTQRLSAQTDALQERMRCPRCGADFLPLEVIPRDLTLPAMPAVSLGASAPAGGDAAPAAPAAVAKPATGAMPAVPAAVAKPATGVMPAAPSTAPAAPSTAPAAPAAPATVRPAAPPSPLARQGGTVLMSPSNRSAPAPDPGPPLAPSSPPEAAPPAPEPAMAAAQAPPEPGVAAPPSPDPVLAALPSPDPVLAALPLPDPMLAALPLPDPMLAALPSSEPVAGALSSPEPLVAALAAPPPTSVPAPARSSASRGAVLGEAAELAEVPLGKLRRIAGQALGYLHVAIGAAGPGVIGLGVLAISSSKVLRVIAGTVALLSLSVAVVALAAHLLLRFRPARAPGVARPARPGSSSSSAARLALAGGALLSLVLPAAVTAAIAAATRPDEQALTAKPLPPPPSLKALELPPEKRADQKLRREGHVMVSGGLLTVPPSFRSDDGAFDLLIHFHGNSQLVQESVAAAKVNALLYVVNAGTGSGPYEERYKVPATFDDALTRIQEAAAKRGLKDAKIRRIGISSWSAGYGAIHKLLESEKNHERIDALMVLDGIHVAYQDAKAKTGVDGVRLERWVKFARAAAEGDKLFTITHSEAKTTEYASASETADAILERLGVTRSPASATPPQVNLAAAAGAIPKSAQQWLEQTTEAQARGLHVRGYEGKTPEHHMAHLIQMSVTVLPELVERWQK